MNLLDIFFKKRCDKGEEIPSFFHFIINPVRPREMMKRQEERLGNKMILCQEHFMKELGAALRVFNYPFIFVEPLNARGQIPRYSQNYFYTIEDLPIDRFTPADQEDVLNILSQATKEKPIIWLNQEVIAEATKLPLVKIKDPSAILLNNEGLINKLINIFSYFPKPQRGEYAINLPYGGRGIFIYYDYI